MWAGAESYEEGFDLEEKAIDYQHSGLRSTSGHLEAWCICPAVIIARYVKMQRSGFWFLSKTENRTPDPKSQGASEAIATQTINFNGSEVAMATAFDLWLRYQSRDNVL